MTSDRIIPVGHDLEPMKPAAACEKVQQAETKAKNSAGRWSMLNHFADVTARTLLPTAVAVWFQLFRNAKRDGLVRISEVELGRRIGRSVRTVYTALRELESAGLILVVHRGSVRSGATVYRIRSRRKDGQ